MASHAGRIISIATKPDAAVLMHVGRRGQRLPGNTLDRSSLALFFDTLPSSGSLATIEMMFLASLNVMCGGDGDFDGISGPRSTG